MKMPLTPDEIARKLAVLPEADAERIMRDLGYTGRAGVVLGRKVRAARVEIAAEQQGQ